MKLSPVSASSSAFWYGMRLWQPQQSAAGGDQAALDLGDAEFRGPRRHDQVGGEHHLGAARQRVALDGGDQRFPRRPFGEADAAAGNRDHLTGGEGLQVHARTEVATCAGDDRHREVVAVVEFVDRVGQTLADRQVHRVARFRPIDGDDENAPLALSSEFLPTHVALRFMRQILLEILTIGLTVERSGQPA